MPFLWSDTRWVMSETHDALVRSLEIRRSGPRAGLTEADLRRSFDQLSREAIANAMPPEAVLEEFRQAWDQWYSRRHGDDPRSLLYYGTLSQCLGAYLERVAQSSSRHPD